MSEHARSPLLELRGVGKVYRPGEVEVIALRDVDLDLYAGELLVVLGPSGCGKSTLLNLIGGIDRPSTGTVRYRRQRAAGGSFELALERASDRELTRYRRDEVGFVFQMFNLIPTLTALENIEVVTELSGDRGAAREALQRVELLDRAGHFPAQLSGGQQQRVAIARALAGAPHLLLCDEPTGAIDQETGRRVLQLLVDACRRAGVTVVLITHNAALARLGDRVVRMRDGGIAALEVGARAGVAEVGW